jgi:integrase
MGYEETAVLSLYRRHSAKCPVHTLKLTPAAKRKYLACDCPLWIYGNTETTHVPRQSTGTNIIAVAEAQRQTLLKNGQDQQVHGPRLDDCIERFSASRKEELGEKTAAAYRFQLDRLRAYCATRGVHFMRELSVDLLEDFKVEGLPDNMAATSKAQVTAKIRCFLREAYRRSWTELALAEKVRPYRAIHEQKNPYTDAEVDLILAGAETLKGGRDGYASAPRTFRLLLELMLETGLRVSDAIRYDPGAAHKGESGLWVYRFAQRKSKRTARVQPTEVYFADDLKTRIDQCQWLSTSKPFWYGPATAGYGLAYQVYDLMQGIGGRCGIDDCRPHRLRDTFAVRALLRNVPIGDVSTLLGHSSVKITETYYAKWIPARRSRLEGLVAETLMNPNGNRLGNR